MEKQQKNFNERVHFQTDDYVAVSIEATPGYVGELKSMILETAWKY